MQEASPSLRQDWHSLLSSFGKNLLFSYYIIYFPDDNIISIKVSIQAQPEIFSKGRKVCLKEFLCLILTYGMYHNVIMKSLCSRKYEHIT